MYTAGLKMFQISCNVHCWSRNVQYLGTAMDLPILATINLKIPVISLQLANISWPKVDGVQRFHCTLTYIEMKIKKDQCLFYRHYVQCFLKQI